MADATALRVLDDDGAPLDSIIEYDGSDIVLRSRGGSGAKSLNSDYSPALKAILRRSRSAGWVLEQVWVDSRQVQELPLSEREIFSKSDLPAATDEVYTLLKHPMARVGRNGADVAKGGNPTKWIRMRFSGQIGCRKRRTRVGAGACDGYG